jgi:hypothetical protein
MRLYKDGITREADDNATVNALLNAGYKKVEDAPAETSEEKKPKANQKKTESGESVNPAETSEEPAKS